MGVPRWSLWVFFVKRFTVRPIDFTVIQQTEAVRHCDLAPPSIFGDLQFDELRSSLSCNPNRLAVQQLQGRGVLRMHRERAGPIAFIPGRISHESVGVARDVAPGHEDERKGRIRGQRSIFMSFIQFLDRVHELGDMQVYLAVLRLKVREVAFRIDPADPDSFRMLEDLLEEVLSQSRPAGCPTRTTFS
jgi:hypothetical protein